MKADQKTLYGMGILVSLILLIVLNYIMRNYNGFLERERNHPSPTDPGILLMEGDDLFVQTFCSGAAWTEFIFYILHEPENEAGVFHIQIADEEDNLLFDYLSPLNLLPNGEYVHIPCYAKFERSNLYAIRIFLTDQKGEDRIRLIMVNPEEMVIDEREASLNGQPVRGVLLMDNREIVSSDLLKAGVCFAVYIMCIVMGVGSVAKLARAYDEEFIAKEE